MTKKLELPKNYPGAQPAKYGFPRPDGPPPPRHGKTKRDKASRRRSDEIMQQVATGWYQRPVSMWLATHT